MSEVFDEIRQEGIAEGRAEGIAEGRAEGRVECFLENLRSVIANMGVSAQEALAILSVPEVDRPRYLQMLRAAEPEVKPA